jgi:hypothetical protein
MSISIERKMRNGFIELGRRYSIGLVFDKPIFLFFVQYPAITSERDFNCINHERVDEK